MLIIRKAESADIDFMTDSLFQLNQIHHDAMPDVFKSPKDIDESKDLNRYLTKEKCFAFVAEVDNELIGFIAGHVRELISPITKSVIMGSIDELFINETHRGTGAGTKLVEALESECKERNATDVFVEIWEFNKEAIRFYEKHGLKTHVRWARKKL